MIATPRPVRSLLLLGLVVFLPWNASMAQKAPVRSIEQRGVSFEKGRSVPTQATPTTAPLHALRIDEVEPNNTVEDAQVLDGALPLTVNGMVEVGDEGDLNITFGETLVDDLEDLYRITTTTTGLAVGLDGFFSDCDLYLATAEGDSVLAASLNLGTQAESISEPALPAGTYIIAVSIFDPDPAGPDTSAYTLTVSEPVVPMEGDEVEPNNTAAQAQPLVGTSPFEIKGHAEVDDVGDLVIPFDDGTEDDLEDLFTITTNGPGLDITLNGFTSDCDLWLLNAAADSILASSLTIGLAAETITEPTLPAGTYIIGVSIYDPDPAGPDTTTYTLTVTADVSTAAEAGTGVPEAFALAQNYPNPFNPETRIAYTLPVHAATRLDVFDLMGRRVRTLVDADQAPGTHAVVWDGRNDGGLTVSSGVYVYRLQAGSFVQTRTLVLMR